MGLLSHPLVILVVGAVLTRLIIPQVTRRWQDRQRDISLKIELASRISEITVTAMMAALDVCVYLKRGGFAGPDKEKQQEEYEKTMKALGDSAEEAVQKWRVENAIIDTQINAYFPESNLPREWEDLGKAIAGYCDYALGFRPGGDEQMHLTNLIAKVGPPPSGDKKVTLDTLGKRIGEARKWLIEDLFRTPVTAVSPPTIVEKWWRTAKMSERRGGRPANSKNQPREWQIIPCDVAWRDGRREW